MARKDNIHVDIDKYIERVNKLSRYMDIKKTEAWYYICNFKNDLSYDVKKRYNINDSLNRIKDNMTIIFRNYEKIEDSMLDAIKLYLKGLEELNTSAKKIPVNIRMKLKKADGIKYNGSSSSTYANTKAIINNSEKKFNDVYNRELNIEKIKAKIGGNVVYYTFSYEIDSNSTTANLKENSNFNGFVYPQHYNENSLISVVADISDNTKLTPLAISIVPNDYYEPRYIQLIASENNLNAEQRNMNDMEKTSASIKEESSIGKEFDASELRKEEQSGDNDDNLKIDESLLSGIKEIEIEKNDNSNYENDDSHTKVNLSDATQNVSIEVDSINNSKIDNDGPTSINLSGAIQDEILNVDRANNLTNENENKKVIDNIE